MSLPQNELRKVHDRRSLDREFHTVGAEKEKERLASADRTSGRQGDQQRKIEDFELDDTV